MSEEKTNGDFLQDLVVIGSSAGGVEALSVLVSTLPLDFPAPVVLAQHLDPSRPSSLDSILQRRTKLPVEVVTDSTVLQAGRIYVVPSNHHVGIRDHHVEIQEDRSKRPRPSVDTLLSTAATAYGEHLIGVILTGSGADGAVGAIDVKNAGGTIIVQNPRTARYPSMPLALPPTVIDFEVELEQIGSLLYDLLKGAEIPPTAERTEEVLREILAQVSRHASIDFHPYKTSTILRRISRRMAVTHNHSMRDYADYLATHLEEVEELVRAFLINVTQFFRDPEAFQYLRDDILPMLISEAREQERVLRFWTAGCATGEEPYSLAMLVIDLLGADFPKWSVKIFATDLDEAAISFARRGIYSENLLQGVSMEYRDRFFERIDHGYRVSKTLRQMVIFGQQDLSRSAPFPRINLVLCRNVLIYFTPELQEYVLGQFAFSLSPAGYLFLGKAETVRPTQSFYELVNKHWKVYRCTGNALPSMRRQTLANNTAVQPLEGHAPGPQRQKGAQAVEPSLPNTSFEIGQLRRFNELMLRFLPIGVVVIDHSYRIITANGMARRLLGLREVGLDMDFLHAVRGAPYHEMRTAIDTVFREHNSVNLSEVELETANGGNGYIVSLSFAPVHIDANFPELALISVADVTQQTQARRQLESAQAEQTRLMGELGTTNKRLGDVNKELMDANEELQVANEELILTHEELQASIEEFETTNEELQATNEELETNNEELQATNEELETTNEELRARSNELQELTAMLERERGRLAEMVELSPFDIMVLRGASLIVEAYSPRYARVIEQREVQGHPLAEVIDLFGENGMEIVRLARNAYRFDAVQTARRVLTHLVRARENHGEPQDSYFTYIVVPSHGSNGKVDGVIMYARDETEDRLREAEADREQLRTVFDNFSLAGLALFDARTSTLLMGSSRYLAVVSRVTGIPEEELVGHTWSELIMPSSTEEAVQAWETVARKQTVVHIPELVYAQDEEMQEFIWDCTMAPLMDDEQPERVRYVLLSLIDVTEQVIARKDLEQIDLLKDEFLSLASHELRTPLTTIQGNAQLLRRMLLRPGSGEQTEEERDRQVQMLDRIVHHAARMTRLIKEMLDITRIRGKMFVLNEIENVDLLQLAQHVIEPYNAGGREVLLHTDEKELRGTYDPDRFEQVLANLGEQRDQVQRGG